MSPLKWLTWFYHWQHLLGTFAAQLPSRLPRIFIVFLYDDTPLFYPQCYLFQITCESSYTYILVPKPFSFRFLKHFICKANEGNCYILNKSKIKSIHYNRFLGLGYFEVKLPNCRHVFLCLLSFLFATTGSAEAV